MNLTFKELKLAVENSHFLSNFAFHPACWTGATTWLSLTGLGTKKGTPDPPERAWRDSKETPAGSACQRSAMLSLLLHNMSVYVSFPSGKGSWCLSIGFTVHTHAHLCQWGCRHGSSRQISLCSCGWETYGFGSLALFSSGCEGIFTLMWILPFQTVWWDKSHTFVSKVLCISRQSFYQAPVCLPLPLPRLAYSQWKTSEVF